MQKALVSLGLRPRSRFAKASASLINMPIPDYEKIMAPALQFFADGKPHRVAEVFEVQARHFNLPEQEQNELLPGGTQRRWHNRANWACYYLYRAGLLDICKNIY